MSKPVRFPKILVSLSAVLVLTLTGGCCSDPGPGAPDAAGCDPHSVPGAPCSDDSTCVATSPCETASCDLAVGRCVVADGLPDGETCDAMGGVCSQRLCCRGPALTP